MLPNGYLIDAGPEERNNMDAGAGRNADSGAITASTPGAETMQPMDAGSSAGSAGAATIGGAGGMQAASGTPGSAGAVMMASMPSTGPANAAAGRAGGSTLGTAGKAQVAGTGGVGAGGAAGVPVTHDACATSVCNADYPCRSRGDNYVCEGQFADWSPTYSASTFKDNGDGTVTDSQTGLTWQQRVPSSYAPACSGKYTSDGGVAGDSCSFEDAKKYCAQLSLAGTGWRLPTGPELESLIDDSMHDPAIDSAAFPATPSEIFWSSSPCFRVEGSTTSYLISEVDFADGASRLDFADIYTRHA